MTLSKRFLNRNMKISVSHTVLRGFIPFPHIDHKLVLILRVLFFYDISKYIAKYPSRLIMLGGRRRGSKEKGEENMISRIWRGWTAPGNADKYEAMLKEEIFVGIHNRHIRGFKSIQLLRREVEEEVEFVTIMVFDSLDAVREFAGEDYELAVVPKKARAVLSHFDERSQHYEIRAERKGEG